MEMMRFDIPLFFICYVCSGQRLALAAHIGLSLRQDKNFFEVNSNSLPLLKDKYFLVLPLNKASRETFCDLPVGFDKKVKG